MKKYYKWGLLLLVGAVLILAVSVNNRGSLGYSDRFTYGDYDTSRRIIKEVMKAYYLKGPNIQYNYAKINYTETSPEEATPQDINYKVCAGFTYAVYNEAFGMNSKVDKFPMFNYDIIDQAQAYYESGKPLDGNLVVYYFNKEKKVNYSANGKFDIPSFAAQLKAGDMLSFTGHAMLVYEVGTNPNTGKKDALIIHSSRSSKVMSRIGSNTSIVGYDNFVNPHGKNKLLDIPNEGSIKTKWLSDFSQFTKDKKTIACQKERCAIIRPFYEDANHNAVFNYKIDKSAYNRSKIRTDFRGFTLYKTVNKGDNNGVHLNDTLEYTIQIDNNSVVTTSGYDYKNFHIEEHIDTSMVDFVSASNGGTYSNGTIKWDINKLEKGKTLKVSYKVTVKDDNKLINKTIVSTGKVYKNSEGFITTGTVKNTVIGKVNNLKKSYKDCYNSYKGNSSSLDLIDKVIECSLGVNYNFKNGFSFDKMFTFKKGTTKGASSIITLNSINNGNENYINMILNDYYSGLGVYTLDGKKVLNLPRWNGTSAYRNKNINRSDFQDGDILIYQINNNDYLNSKNGYYNPVTYTKEDGLYAFIYIDGKFVGVNGSGVTKRDSFTFSYYKDSYNNNSDYKKAYSNIDDYYTAKFFNKYSQVKDNVDVLEYINYLTLYDKDRFVILRPEKIVKDLQKVDIYKDVKRKYIKNEQIDLNTGSLILYYTNGTNEEIKLNDPRVKVTKFDTSKIGKSNDVNLELSVLNGKYNLGYSIEVNEEKLPEDPKPDPQIELIDRIPEPVHDTDNSPTETKDEEIEAGDEEPIIINTKPDESSDTSASENNTNNEEVTNETTNEEESNITSSSEINNNETATNKEPIDIIIEEENSDKDLIFIIVGVVVSIGLIISVIAFAIKRKVNSM